MLNNHKQFVAWRRQVFVRNPHRGLNILYAGLISRSGIYLIGCADEIVYVGQSLDLTERPIDSLGRYYHRVPDVSLPWSLALAPCPSDEMHERESTAIRAFAPKFNTSIPSIPSSEGRMPEIVGYAAVFGDQISTGGAFEDENLRRQMKRAAGNPSPPWRQGKQRKKTGKREPKPVLPPFDPPAQLTGEELREAWRRYGVPYADPLVYPISLCDDGSVVTRDGEFIGTWGMDQYDAPSFAPDGGTVPLLEAPLVGLLCMCIRDWYEEKTGEKL
ncbi:GIY-YIG nuclease family protein [Aurantimonas sp. DM33-3]|uniref:GIY-YIG nuclease family protein n=1 Tax=Aurantimonas sp. DM33-3 TaxID=2766955 RepID=UPI001651D40E|nr:GIY-YIG nuclease family protein [Aurantimonas sp. DM33-3]MBC6717747.1 GIY-YIG nuclease family protein [Aurantimonas sp. DM33-3]